jgi:hypothetical protein
MPYKPDQPACMSYPSCLRCYKPLKDGQPRRWVHLIDGGENILHPDDEALYLSDAGDMYWHEVGADCARTIGLEWTAKAMLS